jgi:hypothetical protein
MIRLPRPLAPSSGRFIRSGGRAHPAARHPRCHAHRRVPPEERAHLAGHDAEHAPGLAQLRRVEQRMAPRHQRVGCTNAFWRTLSGGESMTRATGEGDSGAPRKIRTSDNRFRRPVLYPAELWALASGRRILSSSLRLSSTRLGEGPTFSARRPPGEGSDWLSQFL